jgi:hypothetical protein
MPYFHAEIADPLKTIEPMQSVDNAHPDDIGEAI